jgi:hypothetical protein
MTQTSGGKPSLFTWCIEKFYFLCFYYPVLVCKAGKKEEKRQMMRFHPFYIGRRKGVKENIDI